MIHFTLYARSYCHLCDDMLNALRVLPLGAEFSIEVVDIDADDALLAVYDELVPVLVGRREGQEATRLCHYFLDEASVQSFVDAA